MAKGLDPQFPTMGEALKKNNGYVTAIFGKWHLGDQPETRPWARGFDQSCGLMYSNDMWKYHPENPEHWGKYPLQFWGNGQVTIEEVSKDDQKLLTTCILNMRSTLSRNSRNTLFSSTYRTQCHMFLCFVVRNLKVNRQPDYMAM